MLTTLLSMMAAFSSLFPNGCLFWKIVQRPSLHNIFNISHAIQLFISALTTPFCIDFYFRTYQSSSAHFSQFSLTNGTVNMSDETMEETKFNCAGLFSLRTFLWTTYINFLLTNLIFRFCTVLYADFGLVVSGKLNTEMMSFLYLICMIFLSSSQLSYGIGVYFNKYKESPDHVFGRICNHIELSFQTDRQFKDNFVQPITRLLVSSLIIIGVFAIKQKTMHFVKKSCPTGTMKAFGGTHQRNLLTFEDVYTTLIICLTYPLAMAGFLAIMYNQTTSMETNVVLLRSIHLIYDLYIFIYIPVNLLLRSRTHFFAIWADEDIYSSTMKKRPFYSRHPGYSPRRDMERMTPSESFCLYGPSCLTTITEEWPSSNHLVDTSPHLDWRKKLTRVPTNGKLFHKKKLEHRLSIPLELEGVPGWMGPDTWDTRLVDSEEEVPSSNSTVTTQSGEDSGLPSRWKGTRNAKGTQYKPLFQQVKRSVPYSFDIANPDSFNMAPSASFGISKPDSFSITIPDSTNMNLLTNFNINNPSSFIINPPDGFNITPSEIFSINHSTLSKLKPPDRININHQNRFDINSPSCFNIDPHDIINVAPPSCFNIDPPDIINIAPPSCFNIDPPDIINIALPSGLNINPFNSFEINLADSFSINPPDGFSINPTDNFNILPPHRFKITLSDRFSIDPPDSFSINSTENINILPSDSFTITLPDDSFDINPTDSFSFNPNDSFNISPHESFNIDPPHGFNINFTDSINNKLTDSSKMTYLSNPINITLSGPDNTNIPPSHNSNITPVQI